MTGKAGAYDQFDRVFTRHNYPSVAPQDAADDTHHPDQYPSEDEDQ